MDIDSLKKQRQITRDDIEKLFSSIAPAGKKRDEKIAAVKALNRKNRQGIDISETTYTYRSF